MAAPCCWRSEPWGSGSRGADGRQGEQLTLRREAAEAMAAEGAHGLRACGRHARRHYQRAIERRTERLHAARLVHGRADDREVEAVRSPDIAVVHVAAMKRDVEAERRLPCIEAVDALVAAERCLPGPHRRRAGLVLRLRLADREGRQKPV